MAVDAETRSKESALEDLDAAIATMVAAGFTHAEIVDAADASAYWARGV